MSDPRIKVEWTSELRASVIKRWEEGETAGDIAKTVPGSTRSGILGIIHRAGKKRTDANACQVAGTKLARNPEPKPKPLPAPPARNPSLACPRRAGIIRARRCLGISRPSRWRRSR